MSASEPQGTKDVRRTTVDIAVPTETDADALAHRCA